MLLCNVLLLLLLGTRWRVRRVHYNPSCPSKRKKKSSWSLSPHQPGNPKPGVGSQRGIRGEEQCGSLCKRGRENKPFPLERYHVQAPSEKTTQGRSEPCLLCTVRRRRRRRERRSASGWPHTCAQLNIHSIVRQGEVICDVPHQAFAESNTLSNNDPWSETKSAKSLLLSWDNMATWTALQAEHHSVRLTDWLEGVVH